MGSAQFELDGTMGLVLIGGFIACGEDLDSRDSIEVRRHFLREMNCLILLIMYSKDTTAATEIPWNVRNSTN